MDFAANTLFDIVNARYSQMRHLIVTSQLSLSEIAEKLEGTNGGTGYKTGFAIASRVNEMCTKINLVCKDRRLR